MKSLLLISLVATFCLTNLMAQTALEKADSLYAKRSEKYDANSLLADPANIDQAIELYKQAVENSAGKEKAEATWKLIRAYYFKGDYTTGDSEEKKRIYDLGKELGEKAIEEYPDNPGVFLFTAIVWGVWGEEHGILSAARKGVAGKIKDYCEKVIELDPTFDNAGGYRVLGRVYFKAPKIWPILRWPSNEKAIELLNKSLEIAPNNIITRQFLAEVLYKEDQKEKAMQLLEDALDNSDGGVGKLEDLSTREEMKGLLAEWKK
jgi:tetratricopeptide (TPR) repeat protein